MTDLTPRRRPVSPLVRIVVALVAAGSVLWRLSAILKNPQFWAEDGAVFFANAASDSSHGLASLFHPYAGYLHLIPRLIAVAGSFLPVVVVPAFYAYSAVVCVGVVAWGIQSPRIGVPAGWAAALALGLIPHTGEVYGKVCNIQWITALLLFGILIAEDGRTAVARTLDRAGVVVIGLTGPFAVLASPLFIYRVWRRKSKESGILCALVLAVALAQLPLLLLQSRDPDDGPPPAWSVGNLLAVLGRRLFVSLFGGPISVAPAVSITLLFLAGGVIAYALWRNRRSLSGGPILAVAGSLVILASIIKIRMDQMPYSDLLDGDRYLFTGKVIVVWLVAALAYRSPVILRWSLALLLAAGLFCNARAFVFAPMPDMDWPTYAQAIERGEGVRAPILPRGFYLWVPPRRMTHPIEVAPKDL